MRSRFQFLILTRGFSSIATSWVMSWCGVMMLRARWDCVCPKSKAKLVLSTNLEYAVNWLVTSVSEAVEIILEAGGTVILEPTQIPLADSPSSMIPLATRSSCSICLRDVM
jgi:hypothetical protein